ncbi:MAG: ABC-2 family transporter protein [Candidatus Amesbacteria bacterium]|nr:ABC-2 family transporter protein [Candidatus Amesbacteria bacterium]
MKKYWCFLKIGFQVSAAYPASIYFRVIRHSLLVLLFVLLWTALFKIKPEIGGFGLASITTYYILVEIIDIIYTQTPARMLNRDIKTGDLSNYLLKPLDYWKYLLFYTVGQQLSNSSLSILAALVVFIFFPGFVILPSSLIYFVGFFVFSFIAFLISHQILFIVGTWSFYVSEITHIRQGINQLMGLLGGRWIPLSFFPPLAISVLEQLPFTYLFNFPLKIFQQQVSVGQMGRALFVGIIWLTSFLIIGNITWKKGVEKYEAYGF